MNAKFKTGDKIFYNNQEDIISVSKKNFSNGKISYRLKSGRLANEYELSAVPELQKEDPVETIRNMMEEVKSKQILNYKDVSKMTKTQLVELLKKEKNIDIDSAKMSWKEVLNFVCTELKIQ